MKHPNLAVLAACGLVVATALPGCSKDAPTEHSAAHVAPALRGVGVEHLERRPTLKLPWGDATPKPTRALTGTAEASFHKDGATFLEIRTSEALVEDDDTPTMLLRSPSAASRYALGVAASRSTVLVRIIGAPTGRLKLGFIERGRRPLGGHRAAPWNHGTLEVAAPAASKTSANLATRYYAALGKTLANWGRQRHRWRGTPREFYAFASARLSLLAGQEPKDVARRLMLPRGSDMGDTMRLYTGMTSVNEALQADRGLRLSTSAKTEAATVPLETLKPVPLASHPWPRMIDEVSARLGTTTRIEPLARRVPSDVLYVHFHDLRTAIKAGNDAWEWITPLAQVLERQPGDRRLGRRYERQLAVERTGLAERFGHFAADGVAFVAEDPFLRDGASVGLVFGVRHKERLMAELDRSRQAHLKAAGATGTQRTYTVDGHTVKHTSGGGVDQHLVDLGDAVVVTNTRALARRFIAVAAGAKDEPALSTTGDFQYMRTVYPYDSTSEDGFIFLGDAFVARTTSPRTKILQSRRMRARAELQAVGNASLLYGLLYGAAPSNVDAIIAAGLLDRSELTHEGGGTITLDPERGPRSTRWGSLQGMTPLSSLELNSVTPSEKKAYKEFRETYQTYWRSYIDPVAARVRRSADGARLSVDARMLPLIEGSDYDDIVETAGQAVVKPPVLTAGLQWTFAVGEKAKLRRELDGLGHFMGTGDGGFGWLGDYVMVGLMGHGGLWDLAGTLGQIAAKPEGGDKQRKRFQQAIRALADAPIYVGAHVRDKAALAATLVGLRRQVMSSAPGMVTWDTTDSHAGVDIVAIKPTTRTASSWLDNRQLSVFYATVDDLFLMSLDLASLKWLIDARQAGLTPGGLGGGSPRQADFRIASQGGWTGQTLAAVLDTEASRSLWGGYRDTEALLWGLGATPKAGFEEASLGFLGYVPEAAQGGRFTLSTNHLEVVHEHFGSGVRPRFPALPMKASALTRLAQRLRGLAMGLSIEGTGDHRGLHVTVDWNQAP